MRKDIERKESAKMFALTMILTKILLLAVVLAAFWLAQTILVEGGKLDKIAGGLNLL